MAWRTSDGSYSDGVRVEQSLTEIRAWDDPPEEGRDSEQWPYPDHHVLSAPPESLAMAIRGRLGIEDEGVVTLLTRTVSGGYSTYTQENDYWVTVLVNGFVMWKSDEHNADYNALAQLLTWLDEAPAPHEIEATLASIRNAYKEDA